MDASARAAVFRHDDPCVPPKNSDKTLRRRSSRLSRWLLELQLQSTPSTQSDPLGLSDVHPVGTDCNPYLAYPHMSMAAVRRSLDDAGSMHDYVVVDDDEVQRCPAQEAWHVQPSHDPPASTSTASPRSTVRLINAPSSLRNLHISMHSTSPSATSSIPRRPSRLSMFRKSSRVNFNSGGSHSRHHGHSASVQAMPSNTPSGQHRAPSSWRWRPSVLGHFPSASLPDAHLGPDNSPNLADASRPSMSSTNTCSSFATPTTTTMYEEGDSLVPSSTPSKSSSLFGSLRSPSHKPGTSSQSLPKTDGGSSSFPTLWPNHVSTPHIQEPPGSPRSPARKSSTVHLSFATNSQRPQSETPNRVFVEEQDDQPRVLFTGKSSGSRMSLSSISGHSRHRKKRLVISGIALNDVRRLQAIHKWCQSFGEVDQIIRMPDGDLHISFQKAEVADTVCRVRAKVQITGVGSVHLSWTTGNKRS
ncbi:hypothetical protein F5I97DRAFT_1808479 [Phlebopus sp. FC_14]|nr:hypothetical protein F5I97DRAFT_1808479 [Phlebopus sp. FC_14]